MSLSGARLSSYSLTIGTLLYLFVSQEFHLYTIYERVFYGGSFVRVFSRLESYSKCLFVLYSLPLISDIRYKFVLRSYIETRIMSGL